ncbi:MAG: DUF2845 domain-containing protein [Gammaproteobacteria bacterium]|nr:DUF2845 domain-containing protein [Gammaproteobacteria bacterium]
MGMALGVLASTAAGRRRSGLALVATLSLAAGAVRAQDTMRCGNRLIEVGDLAAKVLALCGQPSYRDTWTFAVPRPLRYVSDTEEWYYNFGSSRLLMILRFVDDRLDSLRSDGYGFPAPPDGRCAPNDIFVGESKYRLLLTCGEPVSRRAASLLGPTTPNGVISRRADGVYAYAGGYNREVYREHWVYNFGPNYLLREVTLDNGRVVDVENGERGFAPQH